MLGRLKGAFRRPLTEADLIRLAEKHLRRPPFPPDYYDVVASIRAQKDGGSLIDLWRVEFREKLVRIGGEVTWQLQRAVLLREIIDTVDWGPFRPATRDGGNAEP